MSSLQAGPSMLHLHQRLLAYPDTVAPCGPALLALLYDLTSLLAPSVTGPVLAPLAGLPQCRADATAPTPADTLMLVIWLLADPAIKNAVVYPEDLVSLLLASNTLMSTSTPALEDEDQREELIRLTLNGLRLKPQHETDRQAQDRLLMVSSSERARVVAASRAAEERAEAIRRALAEKRAREAADKYTRE